MSEGEVWKDIKGYEGFYKVSNKGNIHSVERRDNMDRKHGGRTLRPTATKKGYLRVELHKNGVMKRKLIHRLVAETFVPNPKSFLEVNHKDEVKTNNESSNLEWCDSNYNNNYGSRNERISKKVRAVNIVSGEVSLFNSVTEAINKGYSSAISQACKGVYKSSNGKLIGDGRTYKGHRWSYI